MTGKINRRDRLWKSAREALLTEAAIVHVSVSDQLADRLAWAVVEALRENVTVAENMWRENAEDRKRHADNAWLLVRRAAPFVNAVLCMTIDRFREEGTTAPALEWIADAAISHDEKNAGERIAREIQERLRPSRFVSEQPPNGKSEKPEADETSARSAGGSE